MEARDLIVTPIIIVLVYVSALLVFPYVTDSLTRKYFYPALTLKIIGAILLGIIYQFYYHGGDTYNYHTHGSRLIWQAFTEDFSVGMKLLFADGELFKGGYKYFDPMPFYDDPSSYAVVKIAAFFDLFTFSTYSATGVLFAVLSFSGAWAMFQTFYKKWPHLHLRLAIAILFIPSVIFWGSGILKDTIMLAMLGLSVYCIDKIFIRHQYSIPAIITLILSLFFIYSIRKFMLQVMVPSAFLWIYFKNLSAMKSAALRFLIAPVIVFIFLLTAYFAVIQVSKGDKKYSAENIAKTAQITAYDIRYWSGKDAGSGYSLGELDGTFESMLRLTPAAINVSLFRPYLWEVRNPLMLLSAVESFIFLVVTIYVIMVGRFSLFQSISPDIVFCLTFALAVAFGVGVSTFNFGTLVRYKIVLLPFFATALVLVLEKVRVTRIQRALSN